MMTPARCTSVCTQRSYVLAVCVLVFLLNQVDRYNFSVAPPEVGAPARPITPDEYAVTSGPLFTVVFTVGGVAAAHGGRGRAPVRLLAASLLLWSAATAATAASTTFWHVALARTVQGLGESGCSPFAVAVISGAIRGSSSSRNSGSSSRNSSNNNSSSSSSSSDPPTDSSMCRILRACVEGDGTWRVQHRDLCGI